MLKVTGGALEEYKKDILKLIKMLVNDHANIVEDLRAKEAEIRSLRGGMQYRHFEDVSAVGDISILDQQVDKLSVDEERKSSGTKLEKVSRINAKFKADLALLPSSKCNG